MLKYELKANGLMVYSLVSIHLIALNLGYNKSKLSKTLNYSPSDMLNFNCLEKGLGLASPPHYLHDFSRKFFPMSYSIEWQKLIVWLALLLAILGSMYTKIVCWQDTGVIIFEINLIFLIMPFCYMTKKPRQKLK